MSLKNQLVKDVNDFLKVAGRPSQRDRLTATKLGLRVTGNPNLIFRLRSGKDIHLSTYDKLLGEMERWYRRNGYYQGEEEE